MKSRKDSGVNGLTIIELLIAIGIAVILLSMAMPVANNFYRVYQLDAEKNLLVSLLRQGLNDSLVNRNASAHGLYWDLNDFIVFQGANFAARNPSHDRFFPRTNAIILTGPNEVVFSQLSGRVASSTYSLSNGTFALNVYINSEGVISD